MSIVYYTADISHLNSERFWLDWIDSAPENVIKGEDDSQEFAESTYISLVIDEGECAGLVYDDGLLDDESEIVLSWEDLNEAITGE